MKIAGAAMAFGLMLGTAAQAQAARAVELHANTAAQLADMCAANPNQERSDAAINYCHGFAQGAVDSILHYENKAFCFPSPTPTRTETLALFVRWVRADSSRAQLPAAAGLYRFLRERYPCGK